MSSASSFLKAVLGRSGAEVLERAVGKQPVLSRLLVPRTAIAWIVDCASHSGTVPGTSIPLLFKSESGLYSGAIGLREGEYGFSDVSLEHLAAVVALSLDAVSGVVSSPGAISGLNLAGLGRSLDNLAKAQRVKKTDLPGQTAKPFAQEEPVPPEAPQRQTRSAKPKFPKPKLPRRIPSLTLGKSEASIPCPACGGSQFEQNKFRGCLCNRDWASQVRTSVYSDGYVLEFKPGVDPEAVLALRLAFRGAP